MANNSIPITASFPPIYGENVERTVYPSVHLSIERITPDIAQKMLETNLGNRKLKKEPIADFIANLEWELNNDAITFDENGCLTNGQNRLHACIESGSPIDVIVARGIKRSAQITMDTGVKRSLSDYLVMDGYKNASTVGAIGVGLQYLDTFGLETAFKRQGANIFSTKSSYLFIQENYDSRIEPLVNETMLIRNRFKLQSKTVGILLSTFRAAGDDNLNEFVGQLVGSRPACTSVRLLGARLHTLVEKRETGLKANQPLIAALFIKAWNAYMQGDDIKQLKFTMGGAHPESFPEVFLGYE